MKGILILSSKRGICDHRHILRHWKSRLADRRHIMGHMTRVVVRSNLGGVEIHVVEHFTIEVLARLVRRDFLNEVILDQVVGDLVDIAILDGKMLEVRLSSLNMSDVSSV